MKTVSDYPTRFVLNYCYGEKRSVISSGSENGGKVRSVLKILIIQSTLFKADTLGTRFTVRLREVSVN